MRKFIKKALRGLLLLILLGTVTLCCVNGYVKKSAGAYFLTPERAQTENADCILVLGCYVWEDGTPSPMLQDRLARGVELYKAGAAGKLLMSGDHGRQEYDEVDAMKRYAVEQGVPSEDVFMDHAGFSTYESIYRARDVFQAKKIIIVTQEYHLYRAVYIARQLGLEAYGVAAEDVSYGGQTFRDLREVLARAKDLMICKWEPKPTYLGEAIPISGSGEQTHDETSDFS